MNYRHAFHAGGFSDVLKHVALMLVIEYLKRKDKPFRVIDTHAGAGCYDLSGEAQRTGEYRQGILRLLTDDNPPAEFRPYLDRIAALNPGPGHDIRWYPGSPLLVRGLLRERDRLTAVELHPDDCDTLAAEFAGDVAVKVRRLDGFLALKAFVPPKERRGLVMIDPAYEERGELERLGEGLQQAWKRWPTGIYMAWYPVKDSAEVEAFRQRIQESAMAPALDMDLTVATPRPGGPLVTSGLLLLNPPWQLDRTMETALAHLAHTLGRDAGAGWRLEWLKREGGGEAAG